MTELIEKTSYEARRSKWQDLMQDKYQAMTRDESDWVLEGIEEEIAKQVELAYKAGMLHFNALDHTLVVEDMEGGLRKSHWTKEDISLDIGDLKLLPELYLQAKGFKG